ncbi:lysine-2,3-aminomutase-like protein [Rhizobium sp. ARZ01]|uniref:lysine-2,3-aminomutase-like protein n=1 Tax=Rhizobium sp. ARZ01 TaxID=2769313 RepID=UPI001782FFAC|nr:lysine-2,3-aminomutase-like protein [Rhizobium sp. ARZ01]MBD9374329.1 lysine-2,3-aminomutase-like protein [Rhizobium sp. ARZ01]
MNVARTLRSVAELEKAGLMPRGSAEADVARVGERYAVAVTPAVAALIDNENPSDPIARQFIPATAELTTLPEERADPIGDLAHSPVEGIVHRYPDRVLLKAVHVCPIYCRFCFRREMVGPSGLGTLTPEELDAAIGYIAAHPDIWEVILTGGDPLVLSARRLRELMQRLGAIAHVKVVRFHTRVPVVEPERIDADMVEALQASGKTTYVALHANHPRELTAQARLACAQLVNAGIAMISQTVLLKGVNDDADVLAELMRAFVEIRIRPYYLHHPDLAPGTSHFRLGLAEGRALVEGLRGRISGLCQPTYILDIPGGYGKVPVLSSAVQETDDGCFRIRDFRGGEHLYPPSSESEPFAPAQ